jgi:cystathionine gamma-synthase/methionine-gamma-lyase
LLHPLAAYELHRGLQTLPVRVRAQQSVASKVAGWLSDHPAVDKVFYPGLPECDPLGLVGRQQSGPGAVLAFTTKQAAQVAVSTRLITHAVSLGGVDTLIQHPAGLTHRLVAAEARPDQDLLRLSIGLEDAEDLIDDLAQALAT